MAGNAGGSERVSVLRFSICVACALVALGCENGGAEFSSKFASDFAPARHTVSVLGVYQDGRMALGTWDVLGPYLARALGSDSCAVGYDPLSASDQDLARAIDEFARDDGPTDELLGQLAPAARGDLLLVVTFAGKLPAQRPKTAAAARSAPATSGGAGRRRGGRGRQRAVGPTSAAADPNQLDVSASLFSVAQRRSVALIGMQYRGASVEDAMNRFAERFADSVPDLKCVGWDWSVRIDPQQIRPRSVE